jgi:KDO2-lipid IV(A) lauroyltransferase
MRRRVRYLAKWIFHYVLSPVIPHVPFPLLRLIGRVLGGINYSVNARLRHQIENNLRAVFPDRSPEEIHEICRRNFINHAMHSLEILYLPRIDEEFIKKRIRVHNLEHVERAAEKGRGIVFILGHIGYYYLSGVTCQLLTGVSLNDISQEVSKLDISALDRKILEKRLANYQDRIGGKVFERGGSLLGVIKAIKRNEAITLFLDAFTSESDPIVSLLDRKARMPQGPIRMAMQTGAAIIFSTAIREPDGSMIFTFYDPLELDITGDKKKDLQHNAQKCADLLDPAIRQNPDQWHLWRLFHERFLENHE